MNMGWYHQQMKIVFHKSFGLSYTWHDKLVFWVTNLPKIFIHALKMSVSISRKRDFHLIMFFCPHLDILNNNKRIQVQSNNNKCLFIDLFFFSWQYPKKGHIFWDAKNRKSNMEIGFLDYPFMAVPNPFFKTIFMIKIIHE